MSKPLPNRLRKALQAVINGEGDDIYFVLGYLGPSTARSYMSQLKKMGLAYTYVSNGTVEVWSHQKGRKLLEPPPAKVAIVAEQLGVEKPDPLAPHLT